MGDFFSNLVAGLQNAFSFGDLSVVRILLTLGLAFLIGMYIFAIYRKTFSGVMYSKNFGVSLVMLAMITSFIILPITSNLTLSLGMVGALSIVRFRTAIKDPMDLIFLFWSISIGIICGGGLYEVAVITSVIVTVCILGLDLLPVAKAPMLLVVNASSTAAEDAVMEAVKKYSHLCRVKSRNISNGREDMILELRVKEEKKLVEEVSAVSGVEYVSLLAHDGEVTF